jgi:hypothetical protein
MPNHFMSAARPVGDTALERLNGQPVGNVPRHERMEPASEPINLDDIAGPDPSSRIREAYAQANRRGRSEGAWRGWSRPTDATALARPSSSAATEAS